MELTDGAINSVLTGCPTGYRLENEKDVVVWGRYLLYTCTSSDPFHM